MDWLVEGGVKRKDNSGKVDFILNDLSFYTVSIIEFSMLQYIDNVILPYANEIQEELPLDRINQKVIAPYSTFLRLIKQILYWKKLKSHNIQPLFVPAPRTN